MRSFVVSALIFAAFVGLATLPTRGQEATSSQETDVPLDKLPTVVVDSIKKLYPKAELTKAAQIQTNGATEYHVTVKDLGRRIKLTVQPDGTIEKLKADTELKDLPKPVTATLEKKYPNSELKSAVSVYALETGKQKLKRYEIKIKDHEGKTIEVRITPDGKIKEQSDAEKEAATTPKS